MKIVKFIRQKRLTKDSLNMTIDVCDEILNNENELKDWGIMSCRNFIKTAQLFLKELRVNISNLKLAKYKQMKKLFSTPWFNSNIDVQNEIECIQDIATNILKDEIYISIISKTLQLVKDRSYGIKNLKSQGIVGNIHTFLKEIEKVCKDNNIKIISTD